MTDQAEIDRAAVDILERDTFGRIEMTEEERKRLIETLRGASMQWCQQAANEIERLAAFAQSNAEPVAWQYRYMNIGEWTEWGDTERPDYWREQHGVEVRPLYTAPPRPDAAAPPSGFEWYCTASRSSKDFIKEHGCSYHHSDGLEGSCNMALRPTTPRPDASGLIEAAADVLHWTGTISDGLFLRDTKGSRVALRKLQTELNRSRAADRRTK